MQALRTVDRLESTRCGLVDRNCEQDTHALHLQLTCVRAVLAAVHAVHQPASRRLPPSGPGAAARPAGAVRGLVIRARAAGEDAAAGRHLFQCVQQLMVSSAVQRWKVSGLVGIGHQLRRARPNCPQPAAESTAYDDGDLSPACRPCTRGSGCLERDAAGRARPCPGTDHVES